MGTPDAAENPFNLLGVPETFALEPILLRDALLRAGMRWHPDRFALDTPSDRRAAEERMALMNSAYATLADPLSRAEALLNLRGSPFERGTDRVSCPAVLMAMLELKEEVAEALASGSAARIEAVRSELSVQSARCTEALAEACAAWETAGAPEAHAGTVHARLAEAAYVRRTAEDLARSEVAA